MLVERAGLRTFGKWRREKIEEKRIEVAVDALAAAYKSKHVFEYIRGRLVRDYEVDGESESDDVADLRICERVFTA